MAERKAAFLTVTFVVDGVEDDPEPMRRADHLVDEFRVLEGIQLVAMARGELLTHDPENRFDRGLGYVQGTASGPVK